MNKRQEDPGPTPVEAYDWTLPRQKRWEQKWPHLRVVRIPLDAKDQSGDFEPVMERYYELGYVTDVTPKRDDPDFRWLMQRPSDRLLAKPTEEYQAELAKRNKKRLPDDLDNSKSPVVLTEGGQVKEIQ